MVDKIFIFNNSKFLIVVTVCILFIIVLFRSFYWSLMEIFTPFLMPFASFFIFALTITSLIVFMKFLVRSRLNKLDIKKIISAISILCLIATLLLPIDEYSESARLALYSSQFNEASSFMLENYSEDINIMLPDKYKHLSRGGGEVEIFGEGQSKVILFYKCRGILDNYSVYAYAPNTEAYQNLLGHEDWQQITKIRENWYFCAST